VLFESGGYKYVDLIITVTAPLELRINRVIKRDICTREQVLARMNNQWDDEEKEKRSDFLIVNDNVKLLVPQIIEIDKKIRSYGKIR
ncbi:MAG: dephospho-CoA kinase, partial [Bacteroidota bacterium]|nr:dephospho-CoA kinase [Bacteroidota bacterium]